MMKPSEVLKQAGWKPVKPNVHPQETRWIDPEDGKDYTFGEACRMQQERGWVD